MLGEQFVSLSENKEYDLFNLIDDYQPEYIFIEELSETFIPTHILKRLYSKDRNYKIFETTHSSHSRPENKRCVVPSLYGVLSCRTISPEGLSSSRSSATAGRVM